VSSSLCCGNANPLGDNGRGHDQTNWGAAPNRAFIHDWTIEPPSAQPQETQQPTPVPSDPQTPKAKDGKEYRPGETVGKSKLEKETGTVNDRIFEVLPNYGTVENAGELPPLTSGQKFRLATASVFDWAPIPSTGFCLQLHRQRMIQKSGDKDGTPTGNVMVRLLPTTASVLT
jgi:hypothetical protein